ncbi:aminoacyl-tRNA hydrolase [Patescibacteria group bacterium]|nr:aminoacyl-tRNA hydrolase [Patescibacteria group bacterium]MBU4022921.1 aminoacyl-tRNA hydrolase [Patescibacteria group bacterium]MBU4078305.1 aminoacyl-tRNA hydrolase [Patescibacteria group bacterium]
MYNTKMILIIGLGNPGTKYRNTPHNLGFETLDVIKKQGNFSFWKNKAKLKSKISQGRLNDEKIILAKPQTFMNQSGEAVSQLKNFYKILSKDIWLIHDDLDLGLGDVRIKNNSGAGGHKGVISIIDKLGTKDFIQLKIGIGLKPENIKTEKFVLRKFPKEKQEAMAQAKEKAANELIKNLFNDN